MGDQKLLHAFAPDGQTWTLHNEADGRLVHHRVAYFGMVEERDRRGDIERYVAAFDASGTELDIHVNVTSHKPCKRVAFDMDVCEGHEFDPYIEDAIEQFEQACLATPDQRTTALYWAAGRLNAVAASGRAYEALVQRALNVGLPKEEAERTVREAREKGGLS